MLNFIKKCTIFQYAIIAIIVLFLILKLILKLNEGTSCEKSIYYFNHSGQYVKADSQKFLIMFTGEVGNAWFTIKNIEYQTKDYYKKNETGIYNIEGECIL